MNTEHNNGDDRFKRPSPLLLRNLIGVFYSALHFYVCIRALSPDSRHKPYYNTENDNKYCRYQQCGGKCSPNIRAPFFPVQTCIVPVRRCLCFAFDFSAPELRHYNARPFKTAHIRNGASVVIVVFLFHSRLFVVQMTDDIMARLDLALHGSFSLAFFHTVSAARMEFASLRRIRRRGNGAFKHYSVHFYRRIRYRDRGKKRLCIRMKRIFENRLYI